MVSRVLPAPLDRLTGGRVVHGNGPRRPHQSRRIRAGGEGRGARGLPGATHESRLRARTCRVTTRPC